LWRCYTSQNRTIHRSESKNSVAHFGSSSEIPFALENLAATVSSVIDSRSRQAVEKSALAAHGSDGELTVSEESEDTELSEGEIADQTQRNSALVQQYLQQSCLNECEIRFADGPFEGELLTAAAPPAGTLLHMPDEGDVPCADSVQFQPCSLRDVGLFVDIWAIVSGRCAELGQSRFDPGDLIEATCARHATLLLSETCISLLFIAAIELERCGRGQFLNDVRNLTILTWQEYARRLFESRGASANMESSRRRSGGAEADGDPALEDMCAQMGSREFHLMDIDCKIMALRCLLLACTQPAVNLQKVELKSCNNDPRPKRQAAKNFLAGLDAIGVAERDAKRKRSGNGGISEAIDCSSLATAHQLLGRGSPLGVDRHGNRFYHMPSDPGRIFCESANKMWWMVYESASHILSLLRYLHPSGQEEHLLKDAIVSRAREISRGLGARYPQQSTDETGKGLKKTHGGSKNKASAAASSGLAIPDWLADAEGSFVARQLVCMGQSSRVSPLSISSCLAPDVGFDTSASSHDGVALLFGSTDAHAEAESFFDGDEQLVSRHWLSVFLRRRRFSNQVRLYNNSLYFSGFRSLCSQAHAVNRLVSPLTGPTPTKCCFDELLSASESGCADKRSGSGVDVSVGDSSDLPPVDLLGLRANEWACTHMPGVYEPVMYLKAHALRLSETIMSVVASAFDGKSHCSAAACCILFTVTDVLTADFLSNWRAQMLDSESCSEVKLLILEMEEVRIRYAELSQFLFRPTMFPCSSCFCSCSSCSPVKTQVFSLPLVIAHTFPFCLTSDTGLPPPNETSKRDRETRRSSISQELGSPVSATKGEKRNPSHGVWSHASHRENWRSNLSFGTRPCQSSLCCLFYFRSKHLRLRWILPVHIGIQGIRDVNHSCAQSASLQNRSILHLTQNFCIDTNHNNSLLAAANDQIARGSATFW
jgi:hypothetical protein